MIKESAGQVPIVSDAVGAFLKYLVYSHKPKQILEIGGGIGYSSAWMLSANSTCQIEAIEANFDRCKIIHKTFNSFGYSTRICSVLDDNPRFLEFQENEKSAEKAKDGMQEPNHAANRVIIWHGYGQDYLARTTKKFDFVFLDSAKKDYPVLLPLILPVLNSGGILLADNIKFYKRPDSKNKAGKEGVKEYLASLLPIANLKSFYIEIGDGLMLSILD